MKHKLREKHKTIRDSLTNEEIIEKSKKIKENLFSLPEFKNSKTILFYSSIKSEVKTEDAIKDSLALGKRVVLPITNKGQKALEIFEIKDSKGLAQGPFGILEPKKELPISKEDLDLVIVPGIVFDFRGHRIGYGEGYYDNFLKDVKATKIGLAFEIQIVPEIPAEPHDIKVNKIVTEKRVITCGTNEKT